MTLTADRPTAQASQTFEIVPLSGTIGAELRGLDLRNLTDADVAAIRQEWLRTRWFSSRGPTSIRRAPGLRVALR